jgi:hypothetical protein
MVILKQIDIIQIKHQYLILIVLLNDQEHVLSIGDKCLAKDNGLILGCHFHSVQGLAVEHVADN